MYGLSLVLKEELDVEGVDVWWSDMWGSEVICEVVRWGITWAVSAHLSHIDVDFKVDRVAQKRQFTGFTSDPVSATITFIVEDELGLHWLRVCGPTSFVEG